MQKAVTTLARSKRSHAACLLECAALALVALLATLIYGWIAIGGVGVIGFSDSADYLFFIDFYHGQFFGAPTPEAAEFYRATRFPPLFPLLLAALGGGTHALQYTQAIACCVTVGMFVCYWLWLRRETASAVAAAALTLLVVACPGLFLLTLSPVSEPLAMAITWIAFLLSSRRDLKLGHVLVLSLIAGAASLVRSMSVVLVVALPLWLAMQRHPPRIWIASALSGMFPFVAWALYRRSVPGAQSYLDELPTTSTIDTLGGWPELLVVQPWRIVEGFTRNLDPGSDAISISLAAALLVLASVGWLARIRARRLDAVFIALYLGAIMVWPFPREVPRFLTAVFPLLLLHAYDGARILVQRRDTARDGSTHAAVIVSVLVLGASMPTALTFFDLARLDIEPRLRSEQRTVSYFLSADRESARRVADGNHRVRSAAREAAQRIPVDGCVYATLPYLLQLQSSVRVLLYPASFSPDAPVEGQLAACDYFFVSGLTGIRPTHRPFFPLDQLAGWTQPVLVVEYPSGGAVAALYRREGPGQRGGARESPIRR
jgi:hypothetical protein